MRTRKAQAKRVASIKMLEHARSDGGSVDYSGHIESSLIIGIFKMRRSFQSLRPRYM